MIESQKYKPRIESRIRQKPRMALKSAACMRAAELITVQPHGEVINSRNTIRHKHGSK